MPRHLLLFVLLLTAAPLAIAEEVENPEYGFWKSFEPGSSTTYLLTVDRGQGVTEMEATTRLKSLDAQQAVLAREMVMITDGQRQPVPANDEVIAARVDKSQLDSVNAAMIDPDTPTGNQTIQVAGQRLACTWYDVDTDDMTGRIWLCDEVPGKVTRLKGKYPSGEQVSLELTAFDAK